MSEPPARSPRAVIVDDSEVVLSMMRMLLEDEGWRVMGHQDAFGRDDEIRAFGPDLVLLDLGMRGLSRRLLPLRVQALQQMGARVLLHSGRSDGELECLAAEVGADGHLAKTGDIDHILEVVYAQLAASAQLD